jgi:hypothetical protein
MFMRWFPTVLIVSVLLASTAGSASAQTFTRNPSADPPIVTAENEGWYDRGAPIQFAGDTYEQGGAARFFNSDSMVRAGSFVGIPLYVDTTEEPYSIVYVPIGRGLMQPYERPRRGALAGTTGSHAPTFPVRPALLFSNQAIVPTAPTAPTQLGPMIPVLGEQFSRTLVDETVEYLSRQPVAAPVESISTMQAQSPEPPAASVVPVPTRVAAPPLTPADIQNAREKVWIAYRGERWIPAGPAIPLESSGLMQTGEYAGFPVFSHSGQTDRIFLPSRAGLVAPYQLKR